MDLDTWKMETQKIKTAVIILNWNQADLTIDCIKSVKAMDYSNYDILVAPGKDEIEDSKKMDVITGLNKNQSLNISELSGLIKQASFVVANDTGPAHIAAHLKVNGLALFGPHTTPFKVSIETEKFKTITKSNLKDIYPKDVVNYIKNFLE